MSKHRSALVYAFSSLVVVSGSVLGFGGVDIFPDSICVNGGMSCKAVGACSGPNDTYCGASPAVGVCEGPYLAGSPECYISTSGSSCGLTMSCATLAAVPNAIPCAPTRSNVCWTAWP